MSRLPFLRPTHSTVNQSCMKWFTAILIALICCLDSYSQAKMPTGSLTQDTLYLRKLLDSAKMLRQKDTARQTALAEQVFRMAQKINSKQFIVLGLYEKAVLAKHENAIAFLKAAIPTAWELKDTN